MAPERDSGDQEKAAALTILAELLAGGQTSVLTRKLQFETQQAVYSSAFYSGVSLDDSTFGLIIVPAAGVSLEEGEAALDAAVSEFLQEGVDEEQLARIKFQMKAQQIYSRDDANGLARRYGVALTSGLTVEDVQAWPDVLQAVTAEDVIAAAHEVFNLKNSVTGYLTGQAAQEIGQ